jgi:hypothetical protein
MLLILLFQLFIVKHFIVDFIMLQPPAIYLKGNLTRTSGCFHSVFHAFISYLILYVVLVCTGNKHLLLNPIIYLIVFEFVTHYFINYLKSNIIRKFKVACNTSKNYWILMGFDQLLHHQVYVVMIFILWRTLNV